MFAYNNCYNISMSGNSNHHNIQPDAEYYESIMSKISEIKNKEKDEPK